LDRQLIELGSGDGFCGAVIDNDMASAERYLDAIEDRVLQLKREHVG
jgi:DNA-directed RNA polymerase specialized sigma24 family protein